MRQYGRRGYKIRTPPKGGTLRKTRKEKEESRRRVWKPVYVAADAPPAQEIAGGVRPAIATCNFHIFEQILEAKH